MAARCVGLTTLPPSRANCLEILGASISQSPKGLYRPVQGFTSVPDSPILYLFTFYRRCLQLRLLQRDLWWTKWHCERFFSAYFSFPLSVSLHHCLHTYIYLIYHRLYVILIVGNVVNTHTHTRSLSLSRVLYYLNLEGCERKQYLTNLRHLPRRTDENHENLSVSGSQSNPGPPE